MQAVSFEVAWASQIKPYKKLVATGLNLLQDFFIESLTSQCLSGIWQQDLESITTAHISAILSAAATIL